MLGSLKFVFIPYCVFALGHKPESIVVRVQQLESASWLYLEHRNSTKFALHKFVLEICDFSAEESVCCVSQ